MTARGASSAGFRQAMRHVASSVCIVTAAGGGGRVGITATSVCSVSMSPPLVLACINVSSLSHDALLEAGHFGINVLDESQQLVADVFAGRLGLGRDERFAFAGARWDDGAHGVPMLNGAVAGLSCRLVQRIPAGTHSVLIGEVCEVRCAEGGLPLVYVDGHYHTLGLRPLPGATRAA